ncbi:MAG: two-component sensor histidine kinase [Symbiobacteriaceae bacterium]|nr:two-component sensor histidine kinase [Symbiobacteriaceae bacterium]
MDALFRTGYPHPINLFAALMLLLLPLLSPYAEGEMPGFRHGLAGMIALFYLVGWSRTRVFRPERAPRALWLYLLGQTALASAIYALDGGLTRFLFVLVIVQGVYITPVRRWAWFVSIVTALWLTLYLAISPDPGAGMIATIGMYLAYMLFAAFVTFAAVQQEKQNLVAQQLLDGVDRRHHTLRAYEARISHRTESEERDRLAQTICATLLTRLTVLTGELDALLGAARPLNRETARAVRLQAKDLMAEVRQVVRALRPGEGGDFDDDDALPHLDPPPAPATVAGESDLAIRWTDPIRVYHVWNIVVIVVTTGVMLAALLIFGSNRWVYVAAGGVSLLGAYGLTAMSRQPWNRTLALVFQAGLVVWLVVSSREPLANHLFLIIAAQMVFLVPAVNRWLAASVVFPTLLSGVAMWLSGGFSGRPGLLLTLVAAFAVTNFFGGVMAFMTRRQVEDRKRAVLYAEQLAEVNRLLEFRLSELRRLAIARERVRMAREIHDGLGHNLTIIIMELQYTEQLADEDPAAALEHIGRARQMIETAMATAREMVESLEQFERPLMDAIRDLVRDWQKGNNAQVTLRMQGEFDGLSTVARITIFRTVQESLTNIQKHARANRVWVDLDQLSDRVTLAVTNNDRGGPRRTDAAPGGFGLMGLKERAEALQGEVTAGPIPPGGFQVRLVLPLGA